MVNGTAGWPGPRKNRLEDWGEKGLWRRYNEGHMSKAKQCANFIPRVLWRSVTRRDYQNPKWIGVTCPEDVSQAVFSTASSWHNGVMNRVIMGAGLEAVQGSHNLSRQSLLSFCSFHLSHSAKAFYQRDNLLDRQKAISQISQYSIYRETASKQVGERDPQMSQLLYSVHCKARQHIPLHFLLPQPIPNKWLKRRKTSLYAP